MSRLGEWFLRVVTPYPRIAAFLHHVRHPRLVWAKLRARLRRRRRFRSYRSAVRRGGLVAEVAAPPSGRRFSVVVPVYRVREEHLRAAIASVRGQTHREWELILVDDASPEPHVRRVLEAVAREEPRVRLLLREDNAGIARATDEGLRHATGEFVAFLDHDDLLHPRALELVDRFLAAHPDLDWVFTDEDKVDERGRHREPCVKPGWSHHLLLTFNYVCHLRVVRRAVLERIGGHRPGLDGAQDYDLALRALAAGARFGHLHGVLYHWRTVPTSMARAAAAKPAAHRHALRALVEHARSWPRGGEVTAEVLLAPASFFRVRRRAEEGLEVAVLGDAPLGGRRTAGRLPLVPGAGWAEVVAAARRAGAPVVALPPPGGFGAEAVEELLALLQVPGTALVAGRAVRGHQVAASGWWVREDGVPVDPWFGLDVGDPGYLNLAMVPGPRALPPPGGWVAWREDLLAAWEAGAGVEGPWRLAAGLARLALEAVVTPTVSWRVRGELPHPGPPPAEIPARERLWLRDLGLAHCYLGGYDPAGMVRR